MKIINVVFAFLVFCCCFGLNAQQNKYYAVYFKDKGIIDYQIDNVLSTKALALRAKNNIAIDEKDYFVCKDYLEVLDKAGCELLMTSRWLNCAVVKTYDNIEKIRESSFVKSIQIIDIEDESDVNYDKNDICYNNVSSKTDFLSYTESYTDTQLKIVNADCLHTAGFWGEGITIAVLDDGFKYADRMRVFNHLFDNEQIIATYNLVNDDNIYETGEHGSYVLSVLAGYKHGEFMGAAPNADYLLFKTEDNTQETILEEFTWVCAAEIADAYGVDIISSSLNYTEMDEQGQSHAYSDMDGNTCPVSIGASVAASRGILVVNSAGNYGSTAWKYIGAPADAFDIIAVGGINSDSTHWHSSAYGPSYDGRVKPEICCLSANVVVANVANGYSTTNGTSFATPLIAGACACLLQAFPHKTAADIRNAVLSYSNMYNAPNSELGFGIPDFYKSYCQILSLPEKNRVESLALIYPNPVIDNFRIISSVDFDKIYIYNVNGKLLNSEQHRNTDKDVAIFVDNCSAEMLMIVYIVFIDGRSVTKKVVVAEL